MRACSEGGGVAQSFHPLRKKGEGGTQGFTQSCGDTKQVSDQQLGFPFCSPPP